MAEENTPVTNTPAPEQPVEPAPVKAPELTPTDSAPVARKKFPTWAKVVIGVIVAIALVAGIAIWGFSQATQQAVKVSDKLIADLQSNNPSDAYKLTNSTFQKATSEDELKKIFDSVSSELQGTKSINGKSLTKNNNRSMAVVVYTIEANGSKKYVRVVMEMNGSDWKITNFRTSDSPLDVSDVN